MAEYHLDEFIDKDWDEWPVLENELFDLILPNGEVVRTNTARCELSSVFWPILLRYNRVPITSDLFTDAELIPNKLIEDIQSKIVRRIWEEYRDDEDYNKEEVWREVQISSNRLYNQNIKHYAKYIRGYGSIEFCELFYHQPIVKLRDELRMTPDGLDKAHDEVRNILYNDREIMDNPIVMDLRAKIIKEEQLLQILFVRGATTDIDSFIYPKAVRGRYFDGILDVGEALIESTLAAKALLFQGAPLEQTEYANRRIQLSAANVDLMVEGDCGSTQYAKIRVTKTRFDGLLGNYRVTDQGLKEITPECKTEIMNRNIQIRVPHNCNHRGMQCVCSTCFGTLAQSFPYGTNIGINASTQTQSHVSQMVLKVKHSEGSTKVEGIVLQDAEKDLICTVNDGSAICVRSDLHERGIKLVLKATIQGKIINASQLPLLDYETFDGKGGSRHTLFESVSFEVPHEDPSKRPLIYHVMVSRGVRKSYLSNKFIRYILKLGIEPDIKGNYVVDLTGWPAYEPIFILPNQHVNMRDFASEVVTFIQSSRDESSRHLGTLRQLSHYMDTSRALEDLYDLFLSRITAHISNVSVVMLSMMGPRDGDGWDVRIPNADETSEFVSYERTMSRRSVGANFAYEGGEKQCNRDFRQYLHTRRMPHLLDPLLQT